MTGASEGVQASTAAKNLSRHDRDYTEGEDGWLVAPEVTYDEVYPNSSVRRFAHSATGSRRYGRELHRAERSQRRAWFSWARSK